MSQSTQSHAADFAEEKRKLLDENLIAIFRGLRLFNNLPAEAVDTIARLAHLSTVYRGQTIIEEGEKGEELLLLLEGRVGICLESISPSVEIAINKLNAGEVLGEMSLFEGGPRSATVVALEKCEIATIPVADLNKLFDSQPGWGFIFLRNLGGILSSRLRTMNRRILNLMRVRYY